jgi:hypothetical protein
MNRLTPPIAAAALAAVALFATPAVAETAPFKKCGDAYADGRSHLHPGDPGWSDDLDGDHDGLACENPPWGDGPAPTKPGAPASTAPTTKKPTPPTTKKPAGAVRATPRFTG